MELYNSIINKVKEHLNSLTFVRYDYNEADCWAENKEFELVMARESAYELGGAGMPAVSFSCVSTSNFAEHDEVVVYGPELSELKDDASYARITLLQVGDIESDDENDTEEAFKAIQDIDFVRYKVFPKGFMMRTSSGSGREQVRVSRQALKDGMSFKKLGNLFIKHYKKDINVLKVKEIFITDPSADYSFFEKSASNVHDITMSLSQILKGIPTDCGNCNLKEICDEVEGMKELHFGTNAKQS